MYFTRLRLLALLSCAGIAACDEGSGLLGVSAQNGTAVRVVNVTGAPIDVTSSGQALPGSSGIATGATSSCLTVDAAGSSLGLRPTGSTANFPGFSPTLNAGGVYTVIAFAGLNGTTQFATLPGTLKPGSGLTALRVFHAASGAGGYDVYVTSPGAALEFPSAAGLAFGGSTPFFVTSAGTRQIRFTFTGTQTVAFDAGSLTLPSGQTATLVLLPGSSRASTPTAILVPGC